VLAITISSLGERLSAPLVATALAEEGIPAESYRIGEVLVTNSCFEALILTWISPVNAAKTRLNALFQKGIIPVITGFIGRQQTGNLPHWDAAGLRLLRDDFWVRLLQADEVIIWTDVDGVLTSDPRLVPGACTIPEISYREATQLAHFGQKFFHPKTLRPLMQSEIPPLDSEYILP